MVTSKSFISIFGGALIAIAGCSPPPPSTDGSVPTDGSSNTDVATTEARTYTYVLNELTVDSPDSSNPNAPVAGFNLDNRFSASDGSSSMSCSKGDAPSNSDPDQNAPAASVNAATGELNAGATAGCAAGPGCVGGVDNQLPNILEALDPIVGTSLSSGSIRAELQSQLQQHKLTLILRVTDVNNVTNDDSVTAKLYLAYPTFNDRCDTISPDRQYAISQSSLRPGSTNIEDAAYTFPAKIVNGRLTVTTNGSFVLPLPEIMGMAITLRLSSAQLRADITPTAASGGNLGGFFNGSELYNLVVRVNPSFEGAARSVIRGFVDIEDPTLRAMAGATNGCFLDGTPPRYGNIGVGLRFRAVSASVATAPVAARAAGACGASTGDAGR